MIEKQYLFIQFRNSDIYIYDIDNNINDDVITYCNLLNAKEYYYNFISINQKDISKFKLKNLKQLCSMFNFYTFSYSSEVKIRSVIIDRFISNKFIEAILSCYSDYTGLSIDQIKGLDDMRLNYKKYVKQRMIKTIIE